MGGHPNRAKGKAGGERRQKIKDKRIKIKGNSSSEALIVIRLKQLGFWEVTQAGRNFVFMSYKLNIKT